jgi:hypothetical protein
MIKGSSHSTCDASSHTVTVIKSKYSHGNHVVTLCFPKHTLHETYIKKKTYCHCFYLTNLHTCLLGIFHDEI